MSGIVVGIDGSPSSASALAWAMKSAAAMKLPLTVLAVHQVLRSQWTNVPISYPEGADDAEGARTTAEKMVHEAAAQLSEPPETVTVRALNGLPAEELIDASQDADLVVVGSRGIGGFARLLLGSVSSQVVNHAACPVAVIPAGR